VNVRLTKVAKQHVRAERKWWRENRDERDLFDEELSSARVRLAEQPKLQVYEEIRGQIIRRMYLSKTRNTVYYFIDETAELVWVVALWGQQRGLGPDLGELP
jgi:hypothetical protein